MKIVFFTLLVVVSSLYGGGELALDHTIDPTSVEPPWIAAEWAESGLLGGAGTEPEGVGRGNGTLGAELNETSAFGEPESEL